MPAEEEAGEANPSSYVFMNKYYEGIFLDDGDNDQGLYVKDGRYSLWTKTGFQQVSNFDLKIKAVVVSYKHRKRGYALVATMPWWPPRLKVTFQLSCMCQNPTSLLPSRRLNKDYACIET